MIMTMKEFQKKLNESDVYGKGFFRGHAVSIIRRGGENGDPFYELYRSKKIYEVTGYNESKLIDSFLEGEFEPFSEIQVIKSGYLEFPEAECIDDMKKAITDFCDSIEMDEERLLCGALCYNYSRKYYKSLVDSSMSYYSPFGFEVQIQPRDRLWTERDMYRSNGLKFHNYGTKLKTKGWFIGLRFVDSFFAPPEDRRSVENQLTEIKFILDHLPEGTIFHDNYIRRWEPLF